MHLDGLLAGRPGVETPSDKMEGLCPDFGDEKLALNIHEMASILSLCYLP
jgi:hypothetical protein